MDLACHPVPEPATPRTVMVMGTDAAAVGCEAARRRAVGERVATFIGTEDDVARVMAGEMLGCLDEPVVIDGSMRYEEPDPGP